MTASTASATELPIAAPGRSTIIEAGRAISLPIAGSGVIFLGSALILLCSGALAELIYARGDVRDREFLKLTQTILAARRNPEADGAL